tara:strand:+ start:5348 stop:5491 length:144 start_codon:yes stop_codon:yes gene_type:complete
MMDVYKMILLGKIEELEKRVKELEKDTHPKAKFICLECGSKAERLEE